jgi:hypothetical protein
MKPFFAVLLLTLVLLVLLGSLILGLGVAQPLVPDPENVVKNFIGSLSVGRYEIAREELADDLKMEVSAADLQRLDQDLQNAFGSYELQPGGGAQSGGAQSSGAQSSGAQSSGAQSSGTGTENRDNQATYEAEIKTEVTSLTIRFLLQRAPETGLWQITSLEELNAATTGPQP